MHIHISITCRNLPLLKTFSPAIRCLSGNVFLQCFQFRIWQRSHNSTLSDSPEFPFTFFCCEHNGLYFFVNRITTVIPAHNSTFGFFRALVSNHCGNDGILIPQYFPVCHFFRLVTWAIPRICPKHFRTERHVQLERYRLRRKNTKRVVSRNQAACLSIFPLNMKFCVLVNLH